MIALEQWPVQGVPDGPGAWLMATAEHRAIDLIRRRASYERKLQEIGRDAALRPENSGEPDVDAMDDHIGDDLLRLIFIACHPVLSSEARAALTLRLLGGLTTAEIARAFLVPEATIAQRIVRAKRTLTARRVPFELPSRAEIPGRLTSVLEVIYLMFNEGYAATGGSDWMRPPLCAEAMRLGRVLEIADRLTGHPALAAYAHLPAVRGDLLAKLGRLEEAREEFGRAAALTGNERERALFRARADACVIAVPGSG